MTATTTTTATNETNVLKEGPPNVTADENMVRSGVTGAVLGFLCGGPLLSALLGFLAAYVSQKEGAPGDYARSLGAFGVSVKAKAMDLDEKHHIAERFSKAASEAWDKAKQYDGKYNVLDKARDTAMSSWILFVNYVREHLLLERGVALTGRGYEYVVDKVGASRKVASKKKD
jgi:hypothetical protein